MDNNNRKASREKYVYNVIVFVNGQTLEATARNKSMDGMGLVIDHKVSMGMPIRILDYNKEFIGSVVWCRKHTRNKYYIGVAYHKKNADDILNQL